MLTCPGVPSSSSSSFSSFSSGTSSRSSASGLTFPTISKNTTHGRHSPTGTGTIGTTISSSWPYSGSLPDYTWTTSSSAASNPTPSTYTLPPYITVPYGGYGKDKRQATPTFEVPTCLSKLASKSGLLGLQDACNCLDIATPTPSQIVQTVKDRSTTVTKTSIIRTDSTFVTTPTRTVTQSVNDTRIFTVTVSSPTSVATTVPGTLTITQTSIVTIKGPSPTPSSFNIYYTDNSTSTATAHFFQADPAPGGDGIVITTKDGADFFSIDGMKRLVDGDLFLTKNDVDIYPFALLQTTAENAYTAICDGCGGKLHCDFPGTTGNVFARCFNYLALGQPEYFGQDADGDGEPDCVVIDLLFK